jgi:hypothetical protein
MLFNKHFSIYVFASLAFFSMVLTMPMQAVTSDPTEEESIHQGMTMNLNAIYSGSKVHINPFRHPRKQGLKYSSGQISKKTSIYSARKNLSSRYKQS